MFEMPIIPATIPRVIDTRILPGPIAKLGYMMINAGMIEAADLRTGSAGAARMIERTWERWAAEDGSPHSLRALPLSFHILDASQHTQTSILAKRDPHHAWLVLSADRSTTKWYIGQTAETLIKRGRADLASHAVATLYAGLDAISYSLKPTDCLQWARLMWWHGYDSEKAAKAAGHPCTGMPTRRTFDNRYPAWSLTAKRTPAAMRKIPRDMKRLGAAIEAVESAMRSPDLLRPNVPEFSERAALDYFAVFVRAYAGDYLHRLTHDYFHTTKDAPCAPFHGAWPLATVEEIRRARRGIAANNRLAANLATLGGLMGGIAIQSMGGF